MPYSQSSVKRLQCLHLLTVGCSWLLQSITCPRKISQVCAAKAPILVPNFAILGLARVAPQSQTKLSLAADPLVARSVM